jgi:hypothetical protein
VDSNHCFDFVIGDGKRKICRNNLRWFILILNVLWHLHPMLGNDRETDNETTAVARQRPTCNSESSVERDVFYVIRSKAVSRDRPFSVQLIRVKWSELVGE